MQALLGIEGCAETQNLKQPDVLMLQYLLPERFTPEQVRDELGLLRSAHRPRARLVARP